MNEVTINHDEPGPGLRPGLRRAIIPAPADRGRVTGSGQDGLAPLLGRRHLIEGEAVKPVHVQPTEVG